jgi:DNA invertase Pin-like site-specific DNA recombinase
LDRWGRSTLDVLATVTELDTAGIAFVSAQDNIDMTTAQGRLMMQLLAAFS